MSNPVVVNTTWTLVYDSTVSGDFLGSIQLLNGIAVGQIVSTAPTDTPGGFNITGQNTPIALWKFRGDKLYAMANNQSASVAVTKGLFPSALPDGLFTGSRAMTMQNYIEANVKNGTQFEVSDNNAAVATGGFSDLIIRVGAKPMILKGRESAFTGTGITSHKYEGVTFTGGAPLTVYNLSRITPTMPSVQVIDSPTIVITGTEIAAPFTVYGSSGQGQSSFGSMTLRGLERIFKPNTDYLLRIINNDAGTQKISTYLSWFEGTPDLPLP